MKIALTGATGLIGSRLLELTKDQKGFEIIPLGKIQGFDIQNKDIVFDSLSKIKPDIIIHLAAKTNVDECEEDKAEDSETLINLKILEEKDSLLNFNNINYLVELKGTAFTVNTIGTKNLADFSLKNNTKLIYVSTDYVFSGNENYYTEESEAIPINWYGQTKLWGEEIVKKYLQNSLIVRLSNPYGYKNNIRKDFVWRFIELLETEKEVSLVCDQIITPTFIDDIVWGLFFLINNHSFGTYHLVGKSFVSPYEIGLVISKLFSFDQRKIKQVTAEEFFQHKAKRPFKNRIKNDKLEKLGFKTKTFSEGLSLIKNTL